MAEAKKWTIVLGVGVTLILAIPAYYLGKAVPLIGGSVFALMIGILLAFIRRPAALERGIKFSSKKVLQYSIILIGFGMNMEAILSTGKQSVLVMLSTIVASLATAFLMSKALHIQDKTAILIGVGTSICGGSAIAATAPVIDADDKEIAFSISTVFLFNIMAVLIFPAIGHALGMTDNCFGIFAGTAVNDTSSVVAVSFAYSDLAGETATIVKLTRTLMIIPITLFLAIYRTQKGAANTDGAKYRVVKVFPWFVLGFLLAAVINSTGILPADTAKLFNNAGKFGIITAMAGIGLNTNLKSLFKNGIKPILLGMSCWVAVILTSLLILKVQGLI